MREISAGIIIYRKTEEGLKFLILYHRGNYWNFPKGKIEAEEKSFQAALRETREETGLGGDDLKIDQRFKAYERFTFWRPSKRGISYTQRGDLSKNIKVFKIVIFYLAETKNSAIKISKEHNGYGWFTYKEAEKILGKYKDSQRVLKQANDLLKDLRFVSS